MHLSPVLVSRFGASAVTDDEPLAVDRSRAPGPERPDHRAGFCAPPAVRHVACGREVLRSVVPFEHWSPMAARRWGGQGPFLHW